MPIAIVLMGIVFNLVNAYMLGAWFFYLSPSSLYQPGWLYTPQFIVGTSVFVIGMVINLNSDHIIRSLRKPGDTEHHLPEGGLFHYVSSANYFGEIVEWIGFALLSWSCPAAVFAWWTIANLVPRAAAIHKRYALQFGDDFARLHPKRIFPFIY
jgi:3-oxo-5-alpha-steroid 4-dehydrogenase 1